MEGPTARAGASVHAPGPVNDDPGDALWHRGNGGEAIPGVSTPLNADYWRASMEVALLRMFHRLGAISITELGGEDASTSPYAGRICRFFYGRLSSDFDVVCSLYGRLPGVDPNVIEEQMLGRSRGLGRPQITRARRLIATVKTAWAVVRIPGVVKRRSRATDAWWRSSILALARADADAAVRVFHDARERMREDLAIQIVVGTLQPGFVEQLRRVATAAHVTDPTTTALLSGVTGISEVEMMADLWAVAHHEQTIGAFVERYGYYGPDEGELSTSSWREDSASLDRVLDAYSSMPTADSPVARCQARAEAARHAQRMVLRSAPFRTRWRLGGSLRLARRYTELREQGKLLMLRCLDVARASARVLGRALAARGVLDGADDVFFLTLEEVQRALRTDGDELRARVAERRRLHTRYQELVLPIAFAGDELRGIVDAQLAGTESRPPLATVVEGLGVSPGTAIGIARVILDPFESRDFGPGEVLVCPTTDPGWAPVLSLAGAVILDMGSMLSHGAIIARELGVPCVANTTDGTRRIPNGAQVRVDGTTGVVELLEPPPRPAADHAA